jgi:hypothetical protein
MKRFLTLVPVVPLLSLAVAITEQYVSVSLGAPLSEAG